METVDRCYTVKLKMENNDTFQKLLRWKCFGVSFYFCSGGINPNPMSHFAILSTLWLALDDFNELLMDWLKKKKMWNSTKNILLTRPASTLWQNIVYFIEWWNINQVPCSSSGLMLLFSLLLSPPVIDFICNEAVNNSYLFQGKTPMALNGSLAEAPGSPGQRH